MALSKYEKSTLKDVIEQQYLEGPDKIKISESNLSPTITHLKAVINVQIPAESEIDPIVQAFIDPQKIIESCDRRNPKRDNLTERPTKGEVREHIIQCIGLIIKKHHENHELNTEELKEWNTEQMLKKVKGMSGNDSPVQEPIGIVSQSILEFIQSFNEGSLSRQPESDSLIPIMENENGGTLTNANEGNLLILERLNVQIPHTTQNGANELANPQDAERRADSNTNNTVNQRRRGLRGFFQRFKRTNNASANDNNAQADARVHRGRPSSQIRRRTNNSSNAENQRRRGSRGFFQRFRRTTNNARQINGGQQININQQREYTFQLFNEIASRGVANGARLGETTTFMNPQNAGRIAGSTANLQRGENSSNDTANQPRRSPSPVLPRR